MLVFLRLLGVTNAAVWFGAAFFFLVGVHPAFFSEEMLRMIPQPYAGYGVKVVAERFYTLQYICAIIALVHLVSEHLYAGKPMRRRALLLILVLLGLALLSGAWLQPKIQQLHVDAYGAKSTEVQREKGRKLYTFWSGASQFLHFLTTAALLGYLWRTSAQNVPPRFGSTAKFRG